jgi:SNF2 family DNA or RNA helicase
MTDIVTDMPEKTQVRPPILVDLTPKQRKAYQQMMQKSMARVGDKDANWVIMAGSSGAVITRLQQMALASLDPVWDVGDEDYDNEEDQEGWDAPRIVLSKPSPKLDALMDFITTHEDEPFIVFTWFRGMADLVEEECQQQGISVVKMHGGVTSHKKRTQMVKDFQSGKARVFVGTIAVAGKIITLDRAHHVIFTDRSWKPNDNIQAEDRAWRRNQKWPVRIYEIQARGTVDQIRWEKIQSKEELLDAVNNPERYA